MNVTGEIFNFRIAADASTNSDVLVSLADLDYPGGSENRYMFRYWIPFNILNAASGYQFQVTAGNSIFCQSVVWDTVGGTPQTILNFANPFAFNQTGGGTGDLILTIEGIASGSLALEFAQAVTSAGNPITVYANGYLQIIKIA